MSSEPRPCDCCGQLVRTVTADEGADLAGNAQSEVITLTWATSRITQSYEPMERAAYRADLEAKVRALPYVVLDEPEYVEKGWDVAVVPRERLLRLLTDGAEPPEAVKRGGGHALAQSRVPSIEDRLLGRPAADAEPREKP